MRIAAICHTCARHHVMDFDPKVGPGAGFSDWMTKHPGHDIDFEWPERSGKTPAPSSGWLHYSHNADVKVAYAASASVTITLASLAASSTLLAGRESTAVSNTSNKYLDYLLSGFYKMAASNNQAGRIVTAVVGSLDDTPTWPDVFDGTDSTETVTDQPTFDSVCRIASDIANDNTASQVWYWGPVAIAGLFGGIVPQQFVVFVSQSAHTSTNAWSSTESDHGVKTTGVYATVA
jgi:hypothetical protein